MALGEDGPAMTGEATSRTTWTFPERNSNCSKRSPKLASRSCSSCSVGVLWLSPGPEVAQLYFHRRVSLPEQPIRELKGFERITLAPGATRHLTFHLIQADISFYNNSQRFTAHDMDFDLWVGGSSLTTQIVHASSRSGVFLAP